MARIRTIKPEFWQHPKVTRVSRDARLLFLGLLNEADDEGKLRYSGKRLAGVLFGDDDDVSGADVDAWVAELEAACLAHRYEVDGAQLLIVCGFTEHQKVNHPSPSRLPNPSGTAPVVLTEDSGSPQETLSPDREQGTGKGMEQGENLVELALDVVTQRRATPEEVFAFWQSETNHPRSVLDQKRRRKIAWAQEYYPDDDIADAIRGVARSQFHQGQNERGTRFDDIELVLRDAVHLERFRDEFRDGPVPQIPRGFGALLTAEASGR